MTFLLRSKWLLVILAALVFAGCATEKINWQTRVGNYTYDDAVREFGPPDKSAKLADGTTVADWVVREGHTVVTPGPLIGPDSIGAPMPGYSQTYVPTWYRRLVFGADGKLQQHKNFSR